MRRRRDDVPDDIQVPCPIQTRGEPVASGIFVAPSFRVLSQSPAWRSHCSASTWTPSESEAAARPGMRRKRGGTFSHGRRRRVRGCWPQWVGGGEGRLEGKVGQRGIDLKQSRETDGAMSLLYLPVPAAHHRRRRTHARTHLHHRLARPSQLSPWLCIASCTSCMAGALSLIRVRARAPIRRSLTQSPSQPTEICSVRPPNEAWRREFGEALSHWLSFRARTLASLIRAHFPFAAVAIQQLLPPWPFCYIIRNCPATQQSRGRRAADVQNAPAQVLQ